MKHDFEYLKLSREEIPISFFEKGQLLPIFNPMLPYFSTYDHNFLIAEKIYERLFEKKKMLDAFEYECSNILSFLSIVQNFATIDDLREYRNNLINRENVPFQFSKFHIMLELMQKCKESNVEKIREDITNTFRRYEAFFRMEQFESARLRLVPSPYGLYSMHYRLHHKQHLAEVTGISDASFNMPTKKYELYFPDNHRSILFSYNNVDNFYIQMLFKYYTIEYNNELLHFWIKTEN